MPSTVICTKCGALTLSQCHCGHFTQRAEPVELQPGKTELEFARETIARLEAERYRLREAATIVLLDLDGAALPVPMEHRERLREALAEGGDDGN